MAPPPKRRKMANGKISNGPPVEEITFDTSARQDFLTGFHKRKVQRAKFAQERAEARARQERIDERKKLREERKADLERHVQAVNEMLKPAGLEMEDDDDDQNANAAGDAQDKDWDGLNEDDSDEREAVDHEAEYIDEDKYTTVTVEAMDVTKEGLFKAAQDEEPSNSEHSEPDVADRIAPKKEKPPGKRPWTKERPADQPRKPRKKRNFRYESKGDRKVNRAKERLKNTKQAKVRRAG